MCWWYFPHNVEIFAVCSLQSPFGMLGTLLLIWVVSSFIHNAWTKFISGSIIVLSSTVGSYLSIHGQFLLSVLTLVPSLLRVMPFLLTRSSLNCFTKPFPLWNPLLIAMVGNCLLSFTRLRVILCKIRVILKGRGHGTSPIWLKFCM